MRQLFEEARLSPSSRRAWIEICPSLPSERCRHRSPSSRRAWIEICCPGLLQAYYSVALLAEGVDRNFAVSICFQLHPRVALLAEGVDRNFAVSICFQLHPRGRPPRGGRG